MKENCEMFFFFNEGSIHLLSKTEDCNVMEEVTIIVGVLNDLFHSCPSLFRLHCSCSNVVVPDLRKRLMSNSHDRFSDNYRDSDLGTSLSVCAMGCGDNVPGKI